jgi:predicted acylesterase/phospholipase RssA
MSGVTLELGRSRSANEAAAYKWLRDRMQEDVVVDVTSGTSAGGLNGAFLATSVAYDVRLDTLRTTWIDEGSLNRWPTDHADPA